MKRDFNKVYLNIRVSPKRDAMVRELAKRQEKTLTQIVEEAIDSYVRPALIEERTRGSHYGK